MLGRVALAIVLVVLVLPSAAACSMFRMPDAPGRLYVWDLDEAQVVHHVDVWSRGVDGDCALRNHHDLDGDRMVWEDRAPGGQQGLYLAGVGGNGTPQLVHAHRGYFESVDLDGDLLLAHIVERLPNEGPDTRRPQALLRLDLANGASDRLPIDPRDAARGPTLVDGLVGWQDRDGGFNVYDAHLDVWLMRDRTVASLGGEHEGSLGLINGQWASMDYGALLVRLSDQEVVEPPPTERHWAVWGGSDGNLSYSWRSEQEVVVATRIDTREEVARWSDPERRPIRQSVVDAGRLTLASLSVGDKEWGDGPRYPPEWLLQGEAWEPNAVPLPPWVVLSALLLASRWRPRRPILRPSS